MARSKKETIDPQTQEDVAAVVKEVKKFMTNKKWVSENRRGLRYTRFYWFVPVPEHLSGVLLPLLEKKLMDDGWQKVGFGYNLDKGLTHVKLFQTPETEEVEA